MPTALVLLTWVVALVWFCVVGAWAGALARPSVGLLGAVRVSLWLGFATVVAFVLAAGLVWPLRSTATLVAAGAVTVAAVVAWVLVRRRTVPDVGGGPVLTRSWWSVVVVLALVVAAVVAAHAALGPITNYDTGLYHLNAIQFAQDYPTVPGLANLHTRLGTNVSGFPLAAFGANTPWGDDAFRLVAGLFVLAGFADIALRVLDGRSGTWRRPGTYVITLAFSAAVTALYLDPAYRLASPSPDTMAMVVSVVAGAYLADALVTRRRPWTAVAVVAAAMAASVRTQLWVAFAVTVGVLVVAWLRDRRLAEPATIGSRVLVAAGVVLSVLIGVLLAVRDMILSGWLLFPATYLPVPVDWQVPKGSAESTRDWILSWARDPTVGPEQTLGSWYWLGSWASRTLQDGWVRAGLVLVAVALLAWIVAAIGGRRARTTAGPDPTVGVGGWPVLVLVLLPTLAGLGAWFFTAPDPRFAWGSLLLVGALPAGLACVRLHALWGRGGGDRPGPVGVVVTGLLAVVAVPFGVVQAMGYEAPAGTAPAEVRTYAFGPLSVEASVVPLPRPPIEAFALPDGQSVGLTQGGGDQCWAFIPCMPYPNDALRFRGPTLADGFRTAS